MHWERSGFNTLFFLMTNFSKAFYYKLDFHYKKIYHVATSSFELCFTLPFSTLHIFTGLLQFIDLNGTLFLTFHLLKFNVEECCVTLIQ